MIHITGRARSSVVEHPSDKGKAESPILSARIMATIIMSIGISGSGKTTVMKKIAESGSFEYISPDDIRFEKYGKEDDHSDDKEIWVIARARVADAVKLDKTVVFDSTFATVKRRAHFIAFARSCGVSIIEGLYFEIPLEHVLLRNENRGTQGGKLTPCDYIMTTHAELLNTPPTSEEGFDVLYKIDQTGVVTMLKFSPESKLSTYFQLSA